MQPPGRNADTSILTAGCGSNFGKWYAGMQLAHAALAGGDGPRSLVVLVGCASLAGDLDQSTAQVSVRHAGELHFSNENFWLPRSACWVFYRCIALDTCPGLFRYRPVHCRQSQGQPICAKAR